MAQSADTFETNGDAASEAFVSIDHQIVLDMEGGAPIYRLAEPLAAYETDDPKEAAKWVLDLTNQGIGVELVSNTDNLSVGIELGAEMSALVLSGYGGTSPENAVGGIASNLHAIGSDPHVVLDMVVGDFVESVASQSKIGPEEAVFTLGETDFEPDAVGPGPKVRAPADEGAPVGIKAAREALKGVSPERMQDFFGVLFPNEAERPDLKPLAPAEGGSDYVASVLAAGTDKNKI